MDKTIENIKKILHLGGSKPGKKNEKSEKIVSFSPAENGRVNHHTVTASVEVSRDQAERRWAVNRVRNVASSSCQISRTGLQSTLLQRLAAVWLLQCCRLCWRYIVMTGLQLVCFHFLPHLWMGAGEHWLLLTIYWHCLLLQLLFYLKYLLKYLHCTAQKHRQYCQYFVKLWVRFLLTDCQKEEKKIEEESVDPD